MRDPFLLICGLFCIYPLVFFALPAFLFGRYRPRFRSPIALQARPEMAKGQERTILRRVVEKPKEDKVGYGPS